MEQQLDGTYLHPGPLAKATAIAIVAVSIGTGILLASWGVASVWRPAINEMTVRISNPELRVKQDAPLAIKTENPLAAGPLTAPTIDPPQKHAIKREVTVFTFVKHGAGSVVTGWNYRDGSGGAPISQFCYYTTPSPDGSSVRVDIASNGAPLLLTNPSLVPDSLDALRKCQWWQV